MKYYAVTEDPNELLHYGRLGMKWGQHIFGDSRPKSSGYKRAASKLRASISKKTRSIKSAVKKSSTQRAITKQQRQEQKYNKAVQKVQRRLAITENLSRLDAAKRYERQVNRDYKAERNAQRAQDKQERRYAKNEKKMEKYTQLAREGRLKYGKLSDNQVRDITDRLALERNARVLGNTEKPKFRKQLKEAMREGMLQGVTQGAAAGLREVAIAKVQNRIRNKKQLDKQARQRAEREHEANRVRNEKSHKEIKEDLKQEAYEAEVREGKHLSKKAAESLKNIEIERRIQKKNEEKWINYLDEKGLTNKEALKKFGERGTDSEKREKIMKNEEAWKKQLKDTEARQIYNEMANQEKKRLEQESRDNEYKKLKEKYDNDMAKYKEDKKHDDELRNKYNRDVQEYNAKRASGYLNVKKPDPKDYKYRNTPKPTAPDYDSIKVDTAWVPSYDQYLRLREMGMPTPFGSKNKNKNK